MNNPYPSQSDINNINIQELVNTINLINVRLEYFIVQQETLTNVINNINSLILTITNKTYDDTNIINISNDIKSSINNINDKLSNNNGTDN